MSAPASNGPAPAATLRGFPNGCANDSRTGAIIRHTPANMVLRTLVIGVPVADLRESFVHYREVMRPLVIVHLCDAEHAAQLAGGNGHPATSARPSAPGFPKPVPPRRLQPRLTPHLLSLLLYL